MPGRRRRTVQPSTSRPTWFRSTAGLAVTALVAGLCALVPASPASAAPPPGVDQNVEDIWNGLDALASFSQGLANDGAFGSALTDVGLVPGSPDGIGFANLFEKLIGDRLTSAAPQHLNELVNALNGTSIPLGSGRVGTLTLTSSSNNGIDSLQFVIDVTRQVASAPLTFKSTSPTAFDFSAPVQVDLSFHASFTIGYDTAARSVFIDTSGNATSITLSADAHFPCKTTAPCPTSQDSSAVHAGVGILGVSLSDGSYFDATTNLTASLRDPNSDGRVYLGTFSGGSFHNFDEPAAGSTAPGELSGGAAAAPGMVSVAFAGTPGALHALLKLAASVEAQLPAVQLPGVSADVQIDWADITTGSPTVNVTSGLLSSIQNFQNLTPQDLAQGLARLATALEGIQMSRRYSPTANGKTGTLGADMSAGDTTAKYTKTNGADPDTGDFFRIGGSNGPVREVSKYDSSTNTITFGSPVNDDVASGASLTQVDVKGNIDLPFMKGTLADVFAVNEAIVSFLNKHVKQTYNAVNGGRTGTISQASGQTAKYTVVDGGAPQNGDYYQIGNENKHVTAVSGSGPYDLTFDSAFASPPSDGTSAVQVQLGDVVPDFSSLQSMLVELKNAAGLPGGSSFSIGDVNYDSATSKLAVGLSIDRSEGAAISLDPFQAVDNGTASSVGTDPASGNPTLTDSSKTWQPDVYEGRIVKSGSATNVVKTNDTHTLTFIGPWHGTAPSSGSAYQVGAQDPQVGSIAFANKLNTLAGAAGSGIVNANANIPLATVKPSYSVNLTVVLDLQSPQDGKNGTTCVGMQYNGQTNSQECPFTADNPDGTSTVVTELPTPADRIMIRTADSNGPLHILTADAPIHTAVDLDATVGFLGIHLGGTFDECAQFDSGTTDCTDPASASDHLISVDFKPGLGDAQHDISLAKVFAMLANDPTALAGISVHGAVKASLEPDVSGIPGLSAADFFGSQPSFDLSMSDITDPSTISFSANGFQTALDKLSAFNFDPSNPKALFGEILQTLKILSKTLKTISGDSSSALSQALNVKIPGVGIKLGDVFNASEQGVGDGVGYDDTHLTDADAHFSDDLVGRLVTAGTSTGMVIAPVTSTSLTIKQWQGGTPATGAQYRVENALESAIDMLTASPADNLQQLISLVNNRLGALSVPITISVDTSGNTPVLGLQLDWKRDFHFQTPLAFDFHLGGNSDSIVGTQAKGLVDLHAKAEAKVKLLLSLSTGSEGGPSDKTGLLVDPQNTSLSASVDGGASGYIKANFGPLNLSLGEPVDQNAQHPAEAHATFGVSVGSHDTNPESLSDFFGSVASNGFQFNDGLNGVSCAGDTATDPLALCAALPVYLSTDGGQNYTPVNGTGPSDPPDTLRLRLPLSGDLSDEFKLTDNSGNVLPVSASDSSPRLDIPSTLLTDLQNAVLDFSQLGQGLDGYFKFAEQSLNLASFGGKLPLIGKDLQEGAQFLEHVQQEIDSKLGDLASVSDVSGLRDWINNELADALADVLPAGSQLKVDFNCSATLSTPTNVQGTPATTGTTNHYLYRVAATTASGNKETVASTAITVDAGAALSATDKITVTWDKVDAAYNYHVYRQAQGDSTWKEFDAAQADNPQFVDTGAAGSNGTPRDSGANPALDPCPITSLTGLTLTTDIGQGKVSADKGCEDDGANKCIGSDPSSPLCVPLDIGVPGLSISARTNDDGTPDQSQEVCLKLGWRIHLKIGLDKNRGFYIETQDQTDPEIALGMAVSLPDTINANITFLKVHLCDFATGEGSSCPFQPLVPNGVTRNPESKKPLFAGMFGIDLHTPDATQTAFDDPSFTANDDPTNDITFADLTNLADLKKLVTVGLSAKVHIDWDFQAEIDSSLPGVGGEFKLDWAWGTQLNGVSKPTVATETGNDATPPVQGAHLPDIEFDNVYITAGGFLSGVLKPIVQEVQKFTSPLKPVIDTLYAPIPVLSDLSHLAGGGDVTLITIAEAFSTLAGGPDLTMVERILQVIKLINSIPVGDDNIGIFVGTFHVSGDKAIDTTATPDNSDSLIGNKTARSGDDVSSDMNTQSNGSLNTGKSKAGFSFPLLDHPSEIFNLLMGGDIDLVRFDSGNLTLGFSYSQQFGPVYAPPPVVITISGSASVTARIIAGFDTYGLRKAYESIKAGESPGTVVGNILDSLFLYTTDPEKGDGKPVAVLTLHGELAAGAAVTVLIVSVGVEGGISLTISFYWHDPDNDGKFRLSEFVAAAIQNPLCLFDMEGKLTVFLRIYITFGFGPFSVTFSFTLVNVTLLDFSYHPDCEPPPPELGEVQDHVLYLFFGALGKGAQRGDPWGNTGDDESVKVHELHDENGAFTGFAVDGLNRHEEFLDSSITTVVLDARGYAGKENLVISGDSNQSQAVKDGPPTPRPFDKTAIVFGGDSDDNIKIDGGTAYVDGRGGNDTINLAGNDTAYVAGGANNDNVTVGNGDDTLAGDSSLPITSTVTLANHRQIDSDNPPHGSWSDVASVPNGVGKPGAGEAGDDGSDSILAGYGANDIYGNGGDDTVSIATDKPLTGSETTQPGVNASKGVTIVGGTGNNNLHGGSGDDTIFAGQKWPGGKLSDPNYDGVGGDGTNKVDTGLGSDTAYGGTGSDWIVGHSVSGGLDTLYGGSDSDILVGGNGADQLYGGAGQDYLSGGPAKVDQLSPADPALGDWKITPTPDGKAVDGKLLVGGDNADHIYGANGGDEVYGDRQEDKCVLPSSGPRSTPPDETNSGSPGNDYIIGGNGNNSISGGAGNDTIYAGTGNDKLCGGADQDKMYGGPGKDNMFGGSDKDLLVAGTGNSSLYGNDGPDTIIAGSGNDWVEGNAASDTIDGGTGQSVLIGGTSAAGKDDTGDTIYGGTGNNIIIGDNGIVDENTSWPDSGKPFVEPVVIHTYDLEANAPDNTTFGGNDVISGGSGNVEIYGGLGDDYIVGGFGRDHIEGNPGCDTIYGGTKDDDILGGTSPKAVAGGSVDNIPDGCSGVGNDVTPADLPSTGATIDGNTIYGYLPGGSPNPNHANVIVGGNGSITPTGATDSNDGAPVRNVRQLALLTIGGKDDIHGGPGPDQIFGGLGADTIHTGNGENYVEGNPGADHIYGGTGNEDILGGTSPLTLPTSGPDQLSLTDVPDGEDTIYADGRTSAPPQNAAQDGSDVVLGDNGCVSRGTSGAPTDASGCPTGPSTNPPLWQFSTADPTVSDPKGVLVRPVVRQLDVYDCPNGSCGSPDVRGTGDHIWGGTNDDLLFGEVGDDEVYGGPPTTNGLNGAAGSLVGNDYMEGGAGSDTMAGGAGDDDMIGGSAPTYLPSGRTTAMISDGTSGGNGFSMPAPANSLLTVNGSGTLGNTMDGGAGSDVMLGGNGVVTHTLAAGKWKRNSNDQAFIRTQTDLQLLTIGGDDTMRGGPDDDRMFGGLGADYMVGFAGDDYVEGGPGRDGIQGSAGDDDLVGGTSPIALPDPPAGTTKDDVAAGTPDGRSAQNAQPGNIICGFLCGQSTNGSDDDAIVANNGRIDRCAAVGGVPQGSDSCSWSRTSYGNEKNASTPGNAQDGGITSQSLGNPRTRFVTLLGQNPTDADHNGDDYVEGNSGNDVIWGEDGNDSVHGDTPAANSPALDECLATNDSTAKQDVIVGGYGNDVLCGDGGDDGVLGNRGLVTVVPYAGAKTTIGQKGGAPYGTFTYPNSGNTIYQFDLSKEYVNGVLTAVPNWNNPAATGQGQQHVIAFGGQGNDALHGSPGGDFVEGDDGMHVTGAPAATGGDDIVFTDGGDDSAQGGPGNDHLYGGDRNDDLDVRRSNTDVALKTNDNRQCVPMFFPTISVSPTPFLTADGCATSGFGLQSYQSRFPLVSGTYDSDPGLLDNGGTTKNSTLFGDIMYGGWNRDVMQSDNNQLGDRMIDDFGAYNLEYLCPSAYGGYQVNRALSPTLRTFLLSLSQADGAVTTSTVTSSGGVELSLIYSSDSAANTGPDYPTTPGHFTC
jgi:Ca2+-binding RTX toxin-like protein